MIIEIVKAFLPLLIVIFVWVSFGLYNGRKVRKHSQNIEVDDSRPAGCLTLVRGVEQTNYLRAYEIFVDGASIGSIKSGQTKHIELSPGKYELVLKINWCSSAAFEFEIAEEKNTELVCGATYNNWKCMFMFALKPANWLYVEAA